MSGGMDSTLCAYMMKNDGYEIVALHFNYGQKTEQKELQCFEELVKKLGIKTKYVLDMEFFKQLGASSLVDDNLTIRVDGIKDDVPNTYVPFRNGIFLSMAGAIAEKEGAEVIAIGVVEEDSSGYPDCREEYIVAMQKAINLGTKDETKIEIKMPLVHLKKSQIVNEAIKLDVPLELTWSCYKNSKKACGVCDSCRLRLNGFNIANKEDPIPYE
jgi:7-cyano-7-deazaguanine synthase